MKDDSQENPQRTRYFRYAVLSLAAVLVLSLGFALVPPEPPAPAEPPFSEQARAAALEETLGLRSAGVALAGSAGSGAAGGMPEAQLDRVVTLLTIQARALLLPAGPDSAGAAAPAAATASDPAGVPNAAPPPPSDPHAPATVAEFAATMAASGQERLKDAAAADGGMARLLAGTGTAQLLAAEQLGAHPAPVQENRPPEGRTQAGALSPTGEATAGSPGSTDPAGAHACPATPATQGVSAGAALAAAAEAELETVYGYQAAITRLPPEAERAASDFLARHRDLADQAESYSLLHCGAPSPQPPGYVLGPEFFDAPAAGLARLEAATLPAYGDIVALTGGTTRAWALSALQGAARRAQHWGAGAGPLPGLIVDEEQLPQLPA